MLRIKLVHHTLFLLALPLATIATLALITTAVAQQLTSDGTVSTTVTTPDGKNFNINDGTTRGGNLFHSFKEFSVPTGGSANFNNTANIQNIINRVTGGSISNIDGLIKANGAANVFLLNPAGIIFGPNASLNIGGSFLGSTAHSFLFDNGFEFSATNPQAPSLLTINVPIGLGFRDNPGEIQVRGPGHGLDYGELSKDGDRKQFDSNVTGLQVEPGKTLALVGGNVSVEGGVLRSPRGRIEIGSFDSNQVVNLVLAQSEGFSLAYQGRPSFRDIQFSGQAFANVTGDGSGSIAIIGRNINFTDKSVLLADTLGQKNGGEISIVGDFIGFNRSGVTSNTFGSGNGGQIKLDANNIKFENGSGLSIQTWDNGNAGDINIRANSLRMEGEKESGSALVSLTTGNSTGFAGDINVSVTGSMAIAYTGIVTSSYGTGNAGKININANSLQIDNSGIGSEPGKTGQAGEINFNVADSLTIKQTGIRTNTFGTRDAGKINIRANSFRLEGQITSEAGEGSTGKGGEININAGSLTGNPVISTSTLGIGNAGDINISVTGPLTLNAGTGITTESSGAGNAGKINMNANSLRIDDSYVTSSVTNTSTGLGGEINFHVVDSLTINKSGITTSTDGTGDAGKININANSFRLEGVIQSEAGENSTGNGGEINISANSLEVLQNPPDTAVISTTTSGIGDAGDINITVTGLLTVDGGAIIKTDSSGNRNSNAGNLKIEADTIKLDHQSKFSATSSSGNGGDLKLNIAKLLLLRNGSNISASAGSNNAAGNGGNITIKSPLIVAFPLENSDITANAFSGNGGKITINTQGLFGIQPRSQLTPESDITAFSQQNPSLNGTININTLDIDPTRGLFELSETVIDPAQQIAQNPCIKGFGSTFTITGRGGLPSDPNKILSGDNVRVDLVEPVSGTVSSTTATEKKVSQQPTVKKIIPAQGWIYNEKGQVVLVGYDPTKTGAQRSSPASTSSCAATR